MHSVAIHIRTGGGFKADYPGIQKHFPLRFLPLKFYVNQLKYLNKLLNDKPLYVYFFTDNQEPEKIASYFKNNFPKREIVYDYRKTKNHHDKNVIEDLYHMTEFDYFIRPYSSYSLIAEIIGNHKIVISPEKGYWDENKKVSVITKISVKKYNHWCVQS